jgi:RimJ/RimL family protein N-acetyltransferase
MLSAIAAGSGPNQVVKSMHSLPRPLPEKIQLPGRYARLEPLHSGHAADLFAASTGANNRVRFDYLFETPPECLVDIENWIEGVNRSADKLYFAVIDQRTGRCEGRQALMNIVPEHGCIELGGIYWGPAIARSRVSTEACFLHLQYAFETLGYRRFEWKCHDLNLASKNAAARFGFKAEGVFRQHMVLKGKNRDTAWFSIIDREWPWVKAAFERWLEPENFDAQGRQLQRLMVAPEA